MRVLVTLLLLITFAQANFWDKLNNQELFLEATVASSDSNQSEHTVVIDEEHVKKRILYFNEIVKDIKSTPYLLDENSNSFYNKKETAIQQQILASKIQANERSGYTIAVLRDRFKLDEHAIRQQLYNSLMRLKDQVQEGDAPAIEKSVQAEVTFLKSIDMDAYKLSLAKIEPQSSKIYKDMMQNYLELQNLYNFTFSFYTYLHNNLAILKSQSYISMFDLGGIIEKINDQPYLGAINYYLGMVGTDCGRLFIFVIIVILFSLIRNILFSTLMPALKKLMDDDEEDIKDIFVDNFDRIKKPLSYLVVVFGIDIALEVLVYPEPISETWNSILYLAYLLIYAKIIVVTIDIVLEIFLSTKQSKTKALRKELVNLVVILVKTTVYIVIFLLFIRKLGIDITAFIASLGIGGLAFAFAAKDTIANFFGSIKIIVDNAFSQGDWIKTSDAEGTVVKLGLISTTIRTFDNALVTVPNSSIANSAIKNWNRREVGRRIKMYIGVTYDSKPHDLKRAVDAIREMLIEHPGIATQSESERSQRRRGLLSYADNKGVKKTLLVYVDNFGASSIDILIYSFTNTVNWKEWLEIKEDILYKVWEILEQNHLELAFPSQTIYLQNESANEVEDKKES
jgi:MscS family membrane protein